MSGTVSRSRLSSEYIKVKVVTDFDPTSDTVQIALAAPGVNPVSGDWTAASWTGAAVLQAGKYTAYARRAPGTVAATSEVWVKISDNPEVPVIKAGTFSIY